MSAMCSSHLTVFLESPPGCLHLSCIVRLETRGFMSDEEGNRGKYMLPLSNGYGLAHAAQHAASHPDPCSTYLQPVNLLSF